MDSLEQALEECLAQLASGEKTFEECLVSYPEHAGELRRLLVVVGHLERGRTVQPSPVFRNQTRAKLIAHVNANSGRQATRAWANFLAGFRLAIGRTFGLVFNVAAMLMLFGVTGSVLAQTARPGDALYNWRIATEEVFRTFHPDPVKANLTLVDRHAQDMLDVKGDPVAEELAREDYQDSVTTLINQAPPESRETITEALKEQRSNFEQAEIDTSDLDVIIQSVGVQESNVTLEYALVSTQAGRVTYRLTVTNHGPTSPITAMVTNRFSPQQAPAMAATDAACRAVETGSVSCTVANLAVDTPQELTVTTELNMCYAGLVTNTATMSLGGNIENTNPDNRVVATTEVVLPFPGPAQLVFVQSSERYHNLVGSVTSGAAPLADQLQNFAGAPAWSPDGARLAFFGEEGISQLGGVYERGNGIWLVDIVNGQPQNHRLLVPQDHVKNLVWSPDGAKLAFQFGPPGLRHEVMVVDARDGEFISQFAGEQPAWSADSRQLAIKGCFEECGLWRVNLDGSGAERLTMGDSDSYPAWSPDGRSLVFTSNRAGQWDIYRLRLADRQLEQLTNRPGTDITPVFGPCGQELYLRTDHFGGWRITTLKLDGSNEEVTLAEGVGPTDEWGLARPAIFY
jgi:hypothetical protein